MAENRRYYFLKLKEDFYEQQSIVLLESMRDGILYSNILMKMYLKSLQNNGYLKVNEWLPMTTEMIATLTRHEVGTVERAIKAFMELGLVETGETGTFYMSDIELMVGRSSTEGERKRAARLIKSAGGPALLQERGGQTADICPQNVHHATDICPPESRDKRLENRDQIKESEREKTDTRAANGRYGRYGNVSLTTEEMEALKADFPDDYGEMIEHLSEYMASTGKKYHNHLATMEKWKKEDLKKNERTGYVYNYDCGEGGSL